MQFWRWGIDLDTEAMHLCEVLHITSVTRKYTIHSKNLPQFGVLQGRTKEKSRTLTRNFDVTNFKVEEEICEVVRKKFVFWAWEDFQATVVAFEFSNHFHSGAILIWGWKAKEFWRLWCKRVGHLHSDKQSQQQVWIWQNMP